MSRHLEPRLQLDLLLHSNQRQTSDTLLRTLEVSERTVRSNIAFWRDRYRAPINHTRQRGYFHTDLEWRLLSSSLSKGELFTLALGVRMLAAYGGSADAQELRSAIAHLAERLPEQTWVDLQQVAEERIVFPLGAETECN